MTLMSIASIAAINLVAILILIFAIYLPRHRRTDMIAAFLGVNIGVLAVSMTLASSTVGAGLGLGLFGVLSIIRLRSTEISQSEVAYYFASLAIGLISGMSTTVSPLFIGALVLILAALAFGDAARFSARYSAHQVQLDRAISEPAALVAALEERLRATVISHNVTKIDYVNDLTLVEVRTRRNLPR